MTYVKDIFPTPLYMVDDKINHFQGHVHDHHNWSSSIGGNAYINKHLKLNSIVINIPVSILKQSVRVFNNQYYHSFHTLPICTHIPQLYNISQIIINVIQHLMPVYVKVLLIKNKILHHYKLTLFSSSQFRNYLYLWYHMGKACYKHYLLYYRYIHQIIQNVIFHENEVTHILLEKHLKKGGGPNLNNYFTQQDLYPYTEFDSHEHLQSSLLWEYVDHVDRETAREKLSLCADTIACSIPLPLLSCKIIKRNKYKVACLHNIKCSQKHTVTFLNEMILNHQCDEDCNKLVSLFKIHQFVSYMPINDDVDLTSSISNENKIDNHKLTVFPPSVPSKEHLEHTVNNYCDSTSPEMFEESGCAVCGQLCLTKEIVNISTMKKYFDVLCRPDRQLTRIERKLNSDPIREITGPIIDNDCNGVCPSCCVQLYKKKVPRHALANGFWIGKVPPQLQNLTFAEKLLISRIRHNNCIVRVASGMYKMHSNVVCFELPMIKVYNKLPPHRDDISEVLAFIYIGSSVPGPKELERTPIFVRRNKVADALEWLKLNHKGYADLDISYENLDSYDKDGPPVTVIYQKQTEQSDSLTENEYEEDLTNGVKNGPCPFTVSGLAGEEIVNMLPNTITINAMRHLRENKGGVLAIGDDNVPRSIYNNPMLYSLMFPYLFPYGLGGVGNIETTSYTKISSSTHKRNLLLYHDKHFQLDTYFPLIAFNHEQIKTATTSGYLITKRKNLKILYTDFVI